MVCKTFFAKVLQISIGRIEKCVKKKQMASSSCATDLRGKHSSHKKTPADRIRHAIFFIDSFPKYECITHAHRCQTENIYHQT